MYVLNLKNATSNKITKVMAEGNLVQLFFVFLSNYYYQPSTIDLWSMCPQDSPEGCSIPKSSLLIL